MPEDIQQTYDTALRDWLAASTLSRALVLHALRVVQACECTHRECIDARAAAHAVEVMLRAAERIAAAEEER
jgi:hypothetical protein